METIHAVILGIVQGLTEFLPVSSSGHLVIVPWLFGWKDLGLTFDAALHLGTLFAIAAYFWKDWIDIIKKWRQPFLWLILIGCLPAAIAGFLFEEKFETVFRSPLIIASFMIGMGILLWAAEKFSKKLRELQELNIKDSLFIGFAQMLALMPGVSRSGITMTAGLFDGFNREAAARFSFLLSAPIILGAGLFKMRHLITHGLPQGEAALFFWGMLSSALVGFLAIKFLLKYLQKHTFYVFVWYRFIAGAAIILIWFFSGSRLH